MFCICVQVWDNELEYIAAYWAAQCELELPDDIVNLSPYPDIGGAYGVPLDIESLVEAWHSEGENYTYDNNTCSSTCDNYLQLVWDESMAVGCYSYFCIVQTVYTCVFSSK